MCVSNAGPRTVSAANQVSPRGLQQEESSEDRNHMGGLKTSSTSSRGPISAPPGKAALSLHARPVRFWGWRCGSPSYGGGARTQHAVGAMQVLCNGPRGGGSEGEQAFTGRGDWKSPAGKLNAQGNTVPCCVRQGL